MGGGGGSALAGCEEAEVNVSVESWDTAGSEGVDARFHVGHGHEASTGIGLPAATARRLHTDPSPVVQMEFSRPPSPSLRARLRPFPGERRRPLLARSPF